MTAANLAELAAGPQIRNKRQNTRSSVENLQAAAQLSENAAEHVATSDEPVVNTLWKVGTAKSSQILVFCVCNRSAGCKPRMMQPHSD